MGRLRRTRTREPPGGAQPSPARAIMAGLLQTRNARAGGWVDGADARTPTPEARHGRASRRSLKLIVRPAPPLPPEEALSWGMPPAVGIVGPEDPRPQPSSRGGANVDSRAPLLASLARRALYPSHPPLPSRGGFRGLWAARLSGKPAASHQQ